MPIVGIIIFSIIALIILILIVRNIKIVPQAHAFVIERLGAYHTTWETGLHLKVPFIDRISRKVLKSRLWIFLRSRLSHAIT